MANRTRKQPGDIAGSDDIKIPPQLFSSSRSHPKEKNDDLIVSLSDAYENRRARQVGEWERLYPNNVYRSF